VIRAVVRTSILNNIEIVGITEGWKGMIECRTLPLTYEKVEDITSKGGTILKSSRTNPLKYPGARDERKQ